MREIPLQPGPEPGRVQPRGPSHATGVGHALVRHGSHELSAWSHPSCPQQHEQRPRAGPGARLSHALG